MKFKPDAWRTLQPPPFHAGEYDVMLDSGEVIRATYEQQQWTQEPRRFTQWRGQRLKGMKKHKRQRQIMKQYHADAPDTHAPAAESAHFLARRAVSLNKPLAAYQHYIVLQVLDPALVAPVDTQWIAKFLATPALSQEKVETRHDKVDKFFNKRGGRPARV